MKNKKYKKANQIYNMLEDNLMSFSKFIEKKDSIKRLFSIKLNNL